MEDECAQGETRDYDLWFSDNVGDYVGQLSVWTLTHPILYFVSEESHERFKGLVPDDDYIYIMERLKDKGRQRILLADFLRRFPLRHVEKRVGMPDIELHGSVDDLLDGLDE